MKTIVTNIQRFSLHDGPGIRTTVFLKGCSLHCPWCANPENISFDKQKYFDIDNQCYGEYGYEISNDDLYKELLKDIEFYSKDGGVTFSGGEPLLQFDSIKSLILKLHKKNINIFIETSLFVPTNIVLESINYVDGFIVDCKILNEKECNSILGGNLSLYLKNLELLFNRVNNSNIIIRIPLINGYTNSDENIALMIELFKKYKPNKIEIFSGHNMAQKKYTSLNKEILYNISVSDDYLNEVKKIFNDNNLKVDIIKI